MLAVQREPRESPFQNLTANHGHDGSISPKFLFAVYQNMLPLESVCVANDVYCCSMTLPWRCRSDFGEFATFKDALLPEFHHFENFQCEIVGMILTCFFLSIFFSRSAAI